MRETSSLEGHSQALETTSNSSPSASLDVSPRRASSGAISAKARAISRDRRAPWLCLT